MTYLRGVGIMLMLTFLGLWIVVTTVPFMFYLLLIKFPVHVGKYGTAQRYTTIDWYVWEKNLFPLIIMFDLDQN